MHRHLKGSAAKYVGKGVVRGELYDLGDYPGAVPSEESRNIKGEVYEIGNLKDLSALDAIEEYDPDHPEKSLFVRRKAEVRLENGSNIPAWVYFLPRRPRKAALIQSGDYRQRRSELQK